ncbi:MAG: hypothetical protein IJB52_15105 [Clostridia bacterium]|nr:hypothetical protein [Clostridia bacterium]
MKKTTFILAMLLMITSLGSCSSGDAETTANETSSGAVAAETEPSETEIHDDLPEKDFGGQEYRVRSVTYDPSSYTTIFDPAELNGEIVNDALYNRNRSIEERFNMVFTASEDSYDNNFKQLKEMNIAGDNALEMVMCINRNAFAAAVDGYLTNIDRRTYLDLEKPWYSKDINDSMTIDGKLFFAYSDECLQMFESAILLMFNKDMMTDLQLEIPYSIVQDGQWTFDLFHQYASAALLDLDGDGSYKKGDQFGIMTNIDFFFPSFWISADTLSVAKGADDIPYFNIPGNERWISSMEYVVQLLNENLVYLESAAKRTETVQYFTQREALFCMSTLGRMPITRDMEDDMGILPLPKYDAAQEDYRSRVIDGWLHVVPATISDPEYVSIIMEALACESYKNVFPAYYDNFVSHKILRDEESIAMMNLIKDTRVLDIGDVQWFETIRSKYQSVVEKKNTDFASVTASVEKAAAQVIDDAVAKIKELN